MYFFGNVGMAEMGLAMQNVCRIGGIETTAEQYLERIEKLARTRASSEVIAVCERAIRDYPEVEAFYFHLGEANIVLGHIDAGIRALEKALALNPDSIVYRGKLGDILLAEGRLGEAKECFSAILRNSKSVPHWAYIGLGNALNREGNIAEAVRNFRLALDIAPNTPELRTRLISLYRLLGKESEAADLYESLAREKSDRREAYDAWCKAGALWAQRNEPGKSRGAYRGAYDLDPSRAVPMVGMAEADLALGDESGALGWLDKALACDLDATERLRLQRKRDRLLACKRITEAVKAMASDPPKEASAVGGLYIDIGIRLPGSDGLIVFGWVCDPSFKYAALDLRAGDTEISVAGDEIIWHERPDLESHLGGLSLDGKPGLGFAVFKCVEKKLLQAALTLKATSPDGETGYGKFAVAEWDESAQATLRYFAPLVGKRMARALFKTCGYLLTDSLDGMLVEQSRDFRLAVDFAIPVPGQGLFLSGWIVDLNRRLKSLLLVDEATGRQWDLLKHACRVPRPDLRESFGLPKSLNADDFGFVQLLPPATDLERQPLALYAVLDAMSVIRVPVDEAASVTDPQSAVKSLLYLMPSDHCLNFERLLAYLGPTLEHLWAIRPRPGIELDVHEFGEIPARPEVSLIVPLYGRYDFLRYQLALFADDADFESVELIYVIDDPRIYRDVLDLGQGLQPIFRVPFKTVFGGRNLGYAGANNLGVEQARGRYLLLMNSDVMPKYRGWMGQLLKAYGALENPGVLGPRLLYEDQSIQHAGLRFARYPNWGNLWINEHPSKGQPNWLFPEEDKRPVPVPGVTGACLFVERDRYRAVEGLDERYLYGDFEDSDFCLKMIRKGFTNYYLPAVELYHLERQSQNLMDERNWRRNVTLFNCWQHHRKWDGVIESLKDG
jgi:GT2 family glycosyltransferase/tetratricopeptide (TPR) repeat protein